MFHDSINRRSGDTSPSVIPRGFSSVYGSTASVGDDNGSNTTNTGICRNRKRNIHGETLSESSQVAVPLDELAEMNKLITASIQQNASLVELCQELKSNVAQLRKEFMEIKESKISCQELKSDVAQLKKEFNDIKEAMSSSQELKSDVALLKKEFNGLKENKISCQELKRDVAQLKKEFNDIKKDMSSSQEWKSNVAQLRKEFNEIKETKISCQELNSDVAELKREFTEIKENNISCQELRSDIAGLKKYFCDTKENMSSYQELKSDIVDMRKEFNDIIEGITGSNSKDDAKWALMKKPQRKLPKDLSKLVRKIHSTLKSKYIGEELYNSTHNHTVSTQIIQRVRTEHKDKYDVDKIRAAAHQYYESRRRLYKDSQPERQAQVKKVKETAQRKRFRKRIYERRMKMLDNQRERDYWLQITYEYMTEESEDEEREYIRMHKLSWTSHSLQKLKHKLDERWKARETKSRGFKAIKRVESSISALPPPVNPVKWAVSMTSNSSEAVLVESFDHLDETSMATPSVIPIDSAPSSEIGVTGSSDGFMCDYGENKISRNDVGMTGDSNGFICDDGADRIPRRTSYSIVDYSSDSEDDNRESDWSSPEE